MRSPEPVSRAQLRVEGLSDDQISRLVQSTRLHRIGRGLFAEVDDAETRLRAVLRAHRNRRLVVSHLSAARLLGLPKPLSGWTRPEVTCTSPPAQVTAGLRIAVAPLPARQVALLRGLPITSPARTVVDCIRVLHPRDGLAMADAALRAGLVPPDALYRVLSVQAGWPGVMRARRVVALASGRRESPFESWSAWAFSEVHLIAPEWQMDVFDTAGGFVGRCDTWWPGVAGEADGKSKYRLAAAERGGAGPEELFDILSAERRRERGLRDLRIEVVRWDAGDVLRPERLDRLARRIRDAVRDAEGRTVLGTVRPARC